MTDSGEYSGGCGSIKEIVQELLIVDGFELDNRTVSIAESEFERLDATGISTMQTAEGFVIIIYRPSTQDEFVRYTVCKAAPSGNVELYGDVSVPRDNLALEHELEERIQVVNADFDALLDEGVELGLIDKLEYLEDEAEADRSTDSLLDRYRTALRVDEELAARIRQEFDERVAARTSRDAVDRLESTLDEDFQSWIKRHRELRAMRDSIRLRYVSIFDDYNQRSTEKAAEFFRGNGTYKPFTEADAWMIRRLIDNTQ